MIDARCTSVIFINLDLNKPVVVHLEMGRSLNRILIFDLSSVSTTLRVVDLASCFYVSTFSSAFGLYL